MSNDEQLSAGEVASLLGIKQATWRAYVARGQAPPPAATISRITTDRDGRYVWGVTYSGNVSTGQGYTSRAAYRTGQRGTGLWVWDRYRVRTGICGEWRQIEGACQFNLNQSSASGRRAAVKKYFADPE